ncbi:formate dehydrogenase accessory sulfurtransferase FdhD [Thalassotalea piscium]|uniref:Sulfur carrier protein FdhD n=1 Tax=Thalassotalea piscium TaxID=1230533 RepID=A0A7X0NEZ8_9GAMM|nr:formate dehydrogenase accessory sulfurtransferase FdhD [Thalassotalea piscium]MBB6542229.1 FdhD protein [Thalassotalea piscium]
MKKNIEQVNKKVHTLNSNTLDSDKVICEQPLQIKLTFISKGVILDSLIYTVTMRTPGDESAHITGLLLADGVITDTTQMIKLMPENDENNQSNSWEVELDSSRKASLKSINKYQPAYSSCGLCGNTSLQSLEMKVLTRLPSNRHWLNKRFIFTAENALLKEQYLQKITGGAHSAALFDQNGHMIEIKEDIGRHNALDKLIGQIALTNTAFNYSESYVVISSRVSFEMIQKVLVAGIPVLVALGAPSGLAIKAAKRFNLTLIAFLKADSFNVYHGEWRLKSDDK